MNEKQREALLKANTGRKITDETRKKLSVSHKGLLSGENNPNYGKHPTDETRKKMSESRTGIKSPARKPIMCVETGEQFEYIKQAAAKYNILPTCITASCRGRQKTAGGYHWKYIS